MENKTILCLGDSSELTDLHAKRVAEFLKIQYRGLVTSDSVTDILTPGVCQTSIGDISQRELDAIRQHVDMFILLDNADCETARIFSILKMGVKHRAVNIPLSIVKETIMPTNINKDLTISVSAVTTNKELPKQICMLPWVSLEASPTGGARPCCMFKEEIKDKNGDRYLLTKTPLSNIYNSKYMQNLRKDFRAGHLPKQCSSCWDEEKAGRQSKRMSTFLRLPHLANEVDWENDTPNQLKFIDLKLGNICNLKCRICGSWSSSKWAKEELAYTPHIDKKDHLAYTFLKQGQWPRKAPTFWEDLKTLLPQISYFEFTGGEPFLIQQHFDLLQYAVDQGEAHHIEIHYNTNATTWPEEALKIWRHFKTVEVAFSIDNLGKRFEYERYGAKWKKAEEIIKVANGLRTEMPNIQTQMCLTVNVFNVYYLEELCAWMSQQKFNYDYFNMLHGEKEYRIDQMTPAAKQLVIDKLQNGSFTPEHRKQIDFIINFINNGPGSDGKRFVEKVKKTDEYRKQSLLDTHKEIAEAMGYTK